MPGSLTNTDNSEGEDPVPGTGGTSSVWRAGSFVATLAASWVVMTTTHELGHVIAGWLLGADLVFLEIAPWKLPSSLHRPDPYPLVTLWGGPVIGVLLPLAAAGWIRKPLAWFVADFCLLANGLYLALAWLSGDRFLDTARLIDAGANPVWIAAFCALAIGFGYPRFRRDCVARLAVSKSERIG